MGKKAKSTHQFIRFQTFFVETLSQNDKYVYASQRPVLSAGKLFNWFRQLLRENLAKVFPCSNFEEFSVLSS